ncbi:MAG: host specificity factor TipJ family phage tail protein [Pseudomonadales bacterium]|nr:host specificity factor TipJ family phage tail protein [Pseudomonadales bacterium]
MAHWANAHIGKPWEVAAEGPDSFDCYGLLRHVQQKHFGVEMPKLAEVDRGSILAVVRAIRRNPENQMWQEIETPKEGCVVKMFKDGEPDHIGIWLDEDGGGVLHCVKAYGVCYDSRFELETLGWRGLRFFRRKQAPGPPPEKRPAKKVEITHAMAPLVDIVTRRDEVEACSLNDYLTRAGITLRGPVVAVKIHEKKHPEPITAPYWDVPLKAGECVRLISLPQRGDDGGSNPMQVVASLAVVVASMAIPGAQGLGLTGWKAIVASAAITVGGSLAVNALFPPHVSNPMDHTTSQRAALGKKSISTGSQIPAIDSIMPVAYGKNTWNPPRAAYDWTEFIYEDQYANVLLCLGPGEHEVEKIEIGGSDIKTLSGVSWQLCQPGQSVTLAGFHDNMYTSPHVGGAELNKRGVKSFSGIQMAANDSPYFPGTTLGYYRGVPTNPYQGFADGESVVVLWDGGSVSMTFEKSSRVEGNWIAYFYETAWPSQVPVLKEQEFMISEHTEGARIHVGPYPVCKPSQQVDKLYIDLVHPNGLYHAEDTGDLSSKNVSYLVEYRALNAAGAPIGKFTTLGTIDLTRRTSASVRTTHEFSVTPGCYEVRVSRPVENVNIKDVDRCQWVGLRGRLPGKMRYDKVTVVAMRIKAGTYLNNAVLNDIKITSTRCLPTHNGSGWTAPVSTRSIAWALADICRNGDYSIGLADDRVDIAGLRALDAVWAARGDTLDGILSGDKTFWKVAGMMARAGRGIVQAPGGVVSVKRDASQSIKKASFHIRNIVKNSFSIEYILYEEDTPDDIRVKYTDSETGDAKEELCRLPGADGVAPIDFPMWGVGNRPQARREGLYEAACNMYRRAIASFTAADYTGRPLRRGELISISHPLPKWGVSGEVTGKSGRRLSLSEFPVWREGETHYIQLSKDDGRPGGHWAVTPGEADNEVVMADDPPSWVRIEGERSRTPFQFGPGSEFEALCVVVSATPRGEKGGVDVVAVVDDERVYTAEGAA